MFSVDVFKILYSYVVKQNIQNVILGINTDNNSLPVHATIGSFKARTL